MLRQGQTNGFFQMEMVPSDLHAVPLPCQLFRMFIVETVSANATSEMAESRELQVRYVSTYSKKAEMPIRVKPKSAKLGCESG